MTMFNKPVDKEAKVFPEGAFTFFSEVYKICPVLLIIIKQS